MIIILYIVITIIVVFIFSIMLMLITIITIGVMLMLMLMWNHSFSSLNAPQQSQIVLSLHLCSQTLSITIMMHRMMMTTPRQ